MIKFTNEEKDILDKAADLLISKFHEYDNAITFNSSTKVKQYLQYKSVHLDCEVFTVVFLDSQHRLIESKEMFYGSISRATIHVREVAKHALKVGAANLIFSHNHPSNDPKESNSDVQITRQLSEALQYFDIQVLDHFIIGLKSITSLSEEGYM